MKMRRMRVADLGVRPMRHGKAPSEAVRKCLLRDYASMWLGRGRMQPKRVIAEGLV
jgi:hypothetical protein